MSFPKGQPPWLPLEGHGCCSAQHKPSMLILLGILILSGRKICKQKLLVWTLWAVDHDKNSDEMQ